MIKHNRKRALFLLCWIAYTSTYICRLNFSAAMPELVGNGIFTNTQSALISSCLFITYGAGQLINGVLGDRLNPKNMVFGGLFLSSACNLLLFFFCENFLMTTALWGINGFAQSAVWSPILRICSMYYDGAEKTKFGVDMSTTVPFGTISSYLVSLLAIRFSGYRAVFLSCGLIVAAVSFIWLVLLPKLTDKMEAVSGIGGKTDNGHLKMGRPLLVLCIAAVAVISVPAAVHGALKDGVTGWVPVFIGERFNVATDFSLLLTMILPVVNVTGAYIAKFINKFIKNELLTASVFFAASLVSLIVLKFFGERSIYLSAVCLALITNGMFAVNVLLITLIPLHFARYGKSSTMTGIFNSAAYIGCGASMLFSGVILDSSGWNAVIIIWSMLALGAAVICLPGAVLWNKFKSRENVK